MNRAFLIGQEPPADLGLSYVREAPYEVLVIGSLSIGELISFHDERVLSALAEGKQVLLYSPGLPRIPKNRALAATLSSRQRELKNWGVLFTDGQSKRLITAQEARIMKNQGRYPEPGARMTPLAKEILEG